MSVEKAVIFDMNGVIVDDESYQERAWKTFCCRYGIHFDNTTFQRFILGRSSEEILRCLFQENLSEEKIENFISERTRIVIDIFMRDLAPVPGLLKILKELRQNRFAIGIATSSKPDYIDFVLDGLEIRDFFDVVVDASCVETGKPQPDIYLLVAHSLSVDTEHCLVFEDSLTGIESARNAGMKIIALATSLPKETLINLADLVVDDFLQVSMETITMMLQ